MSLCFVSLVREAWLIVARLQIEDSDDEDNAERDAIFFAAESAVSTPSLPGREQP